MSSVWGSPEGSAAAASLCEIARGLCLNMVTVQVSSGAVAFDHADMKTRTAVPDTN